MRRNKNRTKKVKRINIHDNTYHVLNKQEGQESSASYCDLMWKYFSCGAGTHCLYNHHFMKAVALIGQLYKKDAGNDRQCSFYHNGINYIAKKASVSKQEVKSLSKTSHKISQDNPIYLYKFSYHLDAILNTMTTALKAKASSKVVKDFLQTAGTTSYRDAILGPSYASLSTNKELLNEIENFKQTRVNEIDHALAKMK